MPKGKKKNKGKVFGEPGSLLATASPAMRAKIAVARARYAKDYQSMQRWARQGFSAWPEDEEEGSSQD